MWIQLTTGRGPEECALGLTLFTKKILLPLLKKHMIPWKILTEEEGEINGNRSSLLISAECPENKKGVLRSFQGVIKWIQPSPYRKNHKRKNWFFSLNIFEEPSEFTFHSKDIRFDTTRSSGPGGQNVNKVETAVRALHIPSGYSVLAREERSQQLNKKLALARIENFLKEKNSSVHREKKSELWGQHNSLERGNPAKTYSGLNFKEK